MAAFHLDIVIESVVVEALSCDSPTDYAVVRFSAGQ
jgi:hypothetical protein